MVSRFRRTLPSPIPSLPFEQIRRSPPLRRQTRPPSCGRHGNGNSLHGTHLGKIDSSTSCLASSPPPAAAAGCRGLEGDVSTKNVLIPL